MSGTFLGSYRLGKRSKSHGHSSKSIIIGILYKLTHGKYSHFALTLARAERIDRHLFSMKSIRTFTRVIFMSRIVQENYRIRCLGLRKWIFRILDFFPTENVRGGVLTYLCERDVGMWCISAHGGMALFYRCNTAPAIQGCLPVEPPNPHTVVGARDRQEHN